jgi:hypothetical protein
MEGYRYQQLTYLIIPLLTGVEFFRCAKAERKKRAGESAGAVVMDACGYAFMALIPALFFFTILSIEYHRLPLFLPALHRLDRYGVMFFFLGAWWQIFLITALRARRVAGGQGTSLFFSVWLPYLALGGFISALVLWVAPFKLMWVSFFWFVASFGILAGAGTSAGKVMKIFLVLTIMVLVGENVFFIILDAIV